jgi:hypothetical protein
VLILAIVLYVVAAYALTAPDRRTYLATRGSASAVRSAFAAGAERYRTLRPPTEPSGPAEGSAPKKGPKKGGPRKRPGSKGTGPTPQSTRTLAARVRSGAGLAIVLIRSAVAGLRAVRQGFVDGVERAYQKRYGKAETVGDQFPEEPLLNQDKQSTTEGEPEVNIDVDTDSAVSEYIEPGNITDDVEILKQLSEALVAAQEAFEQHVNGMVSKYEGCDFSTDALSESFSALSEVGETGWASALELIDGFEDAISEASAVGAVAAQAGAAGPVDSFKAS